MEMRYANFATTMERQCLKWDWNQLNGYEVNVLMNAIMQVNERDTETLKKGAIWPLFFLGPLMLSGYLLRHFSQ